MSYLAEERIWYDGPGEPPTTFYGFFLSYGDWDMPVCPFTSEEDRDYALSYPTGTGGLSWHDAYHVAALVTAYGESLDESYLREATEIAGSSHAFDGYSFDKFVENVRFSIWEA
jgi:hypothetical protein